MIDTKSLVEDLQQALPRVTGTEKLSGLDGEIQVYRDAHGIPHIQASSQEDAFFAQGFVTAQAIAPGISRAGFILLGDYCDSISRPA